MKHVVVVGAGKIGSTITDMLALSGDYAVTIVDHSPEQLKQLELSMPVETAVVDVNDPQALAACLEGKFAVLSAAPYHLTAAIAGAAAAAGTNYFDLTEDVESTRKVGALAEHSRTAFMPQCGLAPGFISIVAHDLTRDFDRLDAIRMRVGALPQFPSNGLGYNLTWSTDGLINEYCQPCNAIVDGRRTDTPPMEELEEFSLDGVTYEAFNTSGGLGTLCDTYEGRVCELNYRTIRYPGHAALMKVLLNDLGLRHRREVLKDLLEQALPSTAQDVVVIFVTVTGWKAGRLVQQTYANKIYGRDIGLVRRTAIQVTTASGICAALDLLATGHLRKSGFIRQEDVPLAAFLSNRFGMNFARVTDALGSAVVPANAKQA